MIVILIINERRKKKEDSTVTNKSRSKKTGRALLKQIIFIAFQITYKLIINIVISRTSSRI